MTSPSRLLYRCLLGLHPPAFRKEFAEEMLWIFDEEAAERRTVAHLFADGLVSLLRQWLLRPVFGRPLAGDIALSPSPSLASAPFAFERIVLPEERLPILRMFEGAVMASLFFSLIAMAAVQVNSNAVRRLTTAARGNFSAWPESPSLAPDSWRRGQRPEENLVPGYPAPGSQKQEPGQVQIPDTPAAQRLSAWLSAFNSGDRAGLLQFLEKNYPERAAHVDDELGFREQTGGFELRKVEDSTPTHLVIVVQERGSDQFARVAMDVEPAEPHRITQLDIRAISRPVQFPMPRMSEAQALLALRAELEKATAADRFAGTVLVAKNGKSIFSEAYGFSDRERKIPNQLSTRFRIGSMNKMFTATATLQLVQAGKIKLTDPLGKYLTDYPNKDIATKVTIHQLLTHTGGTGDFFGPEFDAHRLELRTLQDYVKLFGKREPEFEPGSRWEYSNYGFLLLGAVIEKASGQNYYECVQGHVYNPAGMTSTASLPEDQLVPQRSIGYTKFGGGPAWHPNTDTLPYRGTSAGGGYSTAEDLLRFANAVETHKLLDAENTELLTNGKVDTPNGEKYAYGFTDRTEGGVRSFGHGGGAPGMNGDLLIYPQSGYVIVVLANLDPPAAQRISSFIANRLPEK